MKKKKERVYLIAIPALLILIMITLYYAHYIEKNCEQITNKQVEQVLEDDCVKKCFTIYRGVDLNEQNFKQDRVYS